MRWPARPLAVGEDEAEVVAWREATIELYGQKLNQDDLRRLLDRVPVPSTRPEYSEIVLDRDGNLWVKRGPTGDGKARATEYLVFDPSGELLGAVPMPPVRILEIVKPSTSVGTR